MPTMDFEIYLPTEAGTAALQAALEDLTYW